MPSQAADRGEERVAPQRAGVSGVEVRGDPDRPLAQQREALARIGHGAEGDLVELRAEAGTASPPAAVALEDDDGGSPSPQPVGAGARQLRTAEAATWRQRGRRDDAQTGIGQLP